LIFALIQGLLFIAPTPSTAAPVSPSVVSPTASASPTVDPLQRKKLQEEVRQLQIANDRNAGWIGDVIAFAPFITALVAIGTLGAALFKQQFDTARQRREDLAQRVKDRQQRFDEQFSNAVTNLGSDSEGLQAAGAASLGRFSAWKDKDYQPEMLAFLVAQLRAGVSDKVRPLLIDLLGRLLRSSDVTIAEIAMPGNEMNFSGANLYGLDIGRVSFRGIEVCLRETDLSRARLEETNLWKADGDDVILTDANCVKANLGQSNFRRAKCQGTTFDGAFLTSAQMQGADCSGAKFRGASLQSAHFEDSNLVGAIFNAANLNDAYFLNARLDPKAIQSIVKAKNVGKAHFDGPVVGMIQALRQKESIKQPTS
jgi:uncharacterized protein YjbI with pentapeptide repeats